MSKSSILLGCLAAIVIIELSLFLYLSTEELKRFKKEGVFGVQSDNAVVQSQPDGSEKNGQIVILAKSPNSKNIQVGAIVDEYSKKIDGDISIYYKNLATEETIFIDGDKKYYMASLYKIILTLYLLDKVKNGQLSLDEKVGTTSATLEFALDKIITESNNEYAEGLAKEYGWKKIETKMKEKLGIDFSFSVGLETSVKSIGLLFEDIALSLKVTSDETSFLLNLLKDQKKTGKLPKYLPTSIYPHNKTGEFEEFSHDAGIFYTPKANYILVFMSKTKIPGDTNEQMALMSKEVYETLNGK